MLILKIDYADFCLFMLLRECAKVMVNLHATAPESKLRAVYKKFCSSDRCAVALHLPAKNLSA